MKRHRTVLRYLEIFPSRSGLAAASVSLPTALEADLSAIEWAWDRAAAVAADACRTEELHTANARIAVGADRYSGLLNGAVDCFVLLKTK